MSKSSRVPTERATGNVLNPKLWTRREALYGLGAAWILHSADAMSERTVALPAGEGPLDNPLKGWCTYTIPGELHQPYSLVYRYVTWKELEPQEGSYQFDAWERRTWNDALSKGKHVVLRVHLDYPGSPSGIPDWLLAKGLKTRPYSDYGGGRSPDYDDANLVAGLERLIAAMGARYDRNPRVAFIALGLLGFWGEWHTYPHEDWFASATTQQRVVTAYHRAFKHKMLMGRSAAGCLGQQPWLGFHDDMFPADTDGPEDWKFLPKMRQAGRMENWKTAVIGGEMEPRAAPRWLGSGYPTTKATIETGHFTWIGPYNPGMEREQTAEFVARSQEMVRRMGYQFALQELRYTPQVTQGGKLRLALRGQNEGVAPFYYAWPVQLALLNARHGVVEIVPLQADIRTWLPGGFTLHVTPTLHARPGQYRLALGILDPYTGRPALKFASALPYFQGWTVLADLRILS